ncbi:MAG: hypothetical protein IJ593_06245 [Lachnospiraceae bacterium]|nr:hypothetical protein [Lachnospiraceae bacterium]
MNIGFALITGNPFFNSIVDLENEVHEICRFHNRLGRENNIPHTTIFQGSFNDYTDYSAILRDIREYYIDNSTDLKLHFKEVKYVPHGWYFYMCEKTEELKRLHYFTLGRCKEYIVLSPDRLNVDMNELTKDQVLGIEKYGYRYSANAFSPHITLGRNDIGINKDQINMLNKRISSILTDPVIERITVYKMGKDGMHTETLDEVFF